jgi:hypothetical protein
MKTFKILAVPIIIITVFFESASGQLAQKLKDQELIGIGSVLNDNPDTALPTGNTSGSYLMSGSIPEWMKLTNKMSVPFFIANKYSYDLLNKPIVVNGIYGKLSGKSGYMEVGGTGGTFNAKWERLTGKPVIDTSTVYYYPLKITNTPSLSNNQLYRISAIIFNITMSTIYTHAYAPQKQPEAAYPRK